MKEIGYAAASKTIAATAIEFDCTTSKVEYWKKKIRHPSFKAKQHGGKRYDRFLTANLLRYQKFTDEEVRFIKGFLKATIKWNPTQHIQEMVSDLGKLGYKVSASYVARIFQKWRWSWKKPEYKQLNKCTHKNIQYYISYLRWLHSKSTWDNIKFLDEVHFVPKGNSLLLNSNQLDLRRNRALGPKGSSVTLVDTHMLDSDHYSITALVQLHEDHPVVISAPRKESNSQIDFLKFLADAIAGGYLIPGDTLVLDNASVHSGKDTFQALYELLSICNIELVYLPTYSPELNPIELVFMWVKRYLRENRSEAPLYVDIATAFSKIDIDLVENFYIKSCYYF